MIKFVYGAPGFGKTHYVFERLREDFENSILIVPEQQTVICERLALERLPAESQLSFEVLNFSRLCNRVFRSFGGLSYNYISTGMRSLFMWRTLRELSPLLEEYRTESNESAMTPVMLSSIAELKNAAIKPAELEAAAEKLPSDSALRGKLRDIALVFASYDNLVKQSFDDTEDDLYKLCEIADREKIFKGKKVYIDSFSSFTAPELAVIKRIFEQADDVTVTLGCESPKLNLICNESLKKTATKLSELCVKLSKKTENIFLTENHRAKNAELRELNSSLWSMGSITSAGERIPEKERGNVNVISCKNAYAEADAVVGIILEQIERGLRYRDIAVISRDISTRKGILDAALEASSIPYFMSRSSALAANPVIRLISSALRIRSLGFRADDVMTNLNTGLYGIDRRDADLFSEYVHTWSISGRRFTDGDWSMNPDGYTGVLTERGKKILAAANRVRAELIGKLEEFFIHLDAAENARDMCRAIYGYFESIDLRETLRTLARAELDSGRRREATDILAVWNLMMGIFDDIASALGEEKLTPDEFLKAFMLEVSSAKIGAIPTGYDEVTVGSASLLRTDGIKCAILVGVNDDEFPRSVRDDGIFSDSDREKLAALGISVSASLGERASEEFLYARRAMTAPSERLYMLYCTSSSTGKSLRPSLLIGRTKKLFDYITEESYEDSPIVNTVRSTAVATGRLPEIEASAEGTALRELLEESGAVRQDRRISLPDCRIEKETADLVFGNEIRLSQSKIDKYVLCGFDYCCEYILSLRPDEKAEVGYNIMGSFIHSLLEEFLKLAVTGDGIDLSFPEEKTEATADRIIEKLIDDICPAEKRSSVRMSNLFIRLRRLSMLMIRNLRDEFAHSSFSPEYFELKIGAHGGVDPLVFKLGDGTSVSLRGVIDRVDLMKKDGEVYVRVVDYKTGAKEFSVSDIKEGLNLQLLIYIFTLCRKNTEFSRELGCEPNKAPIPVAAHYLSSALSVKKLDQPKDSEEILNDASERLSRSGIYRNDPELLFALNSDLKKNMLGGITQKDGVFKGGGLLAPTEFDELAGELEKTVLRIAGEMRSGRADASPLSPSLDRPCEYCKMKFVCRSASAKHRKTKGKKMASTPTPSQSLAIETKNRTLLLSAAAGSGKTATLTQRIITHLTDKNDPADISRMLIVTFTRAAAAELRERITKALSQALADDPTNPHLNRQALLVGSADICTIDSFCLDVVKSNFQRLALDNGTPLPPDFRLADSTELTALRLSVMNDLIDEWYDKPHGSIDFASFAENFAGTRDDGDLAQTLIEFAERSSLYKNGDDFAIESANDLLCAAENDEFFDSAPGKKVKDLTRDTLEYYVSILCDAIDYLSGVPTAEAKYIPAFATDLEAAKNALAALERGYAETVRVLADYSPLGLKSLGKNADDHTAYYKTRRDEVKKGILALRSSYYSFDPEALSHYIELTGRNAAVLGSFTKDYNRRIAHEKAIRHICDFADIKRLAYKLLVKPDGSATDIAISLREKYDAVYIDEYQDVDPLQDSIFAAVARDNGRFMVGDIKQSIYGFRGSDPSIFGKYRGDFLPIESSEEGRGCSIFMSENFRCNRPIIDFTNLVSRATFAAAGGAVDYRDSDDLVNGKTDGGELPVKLAFILPPDKDSELEFETEKSEIRYIVGEIAALLKDGVKDNGNPITPSDIAVLTRSSNLCAAIGDALALAGIPSSDSVSRDYFANPEVLLILSLISTIDNPHRDVRLAGALRSPVFNFSMDDLVKIRLSADSSYSLFEALENYEGDPELELRCEKLKEELALLRKKAYSLPLDRLVRELFSQFSLTSLELPDDHRSPSQIRDNILRFYEYARSFSEHSGGDLGSFIKYIDDIISAGVKTESESDREDGKVSIMTIHKSKGLEFPVVFLCGCGSKFNRDSLKKSLLYDADSGIGMQITDKTGFARVDTPVRAAIAKSITDRETEEEMRILYVALTRARERLYVTAKLEKTKLERAQGDLFPKRYLCRHSVLSAKSFLDWLLPVAMEAHPSFELSLLSSEEIPDTVRKKEAQKDANAEEDREKIDSFKQIFKERFERSYAYPASLALPAKLSVSKLYPTVLDDDGAATLEGEELPELISKPLFMLESKEEQNKATAAERGTATHLFLQFCDFSNAEQNGIKSELSRLTAERFIPAGTAELVNIRQLEKFFESRLYRSAKSAKKIYREQRFNLFLSASDFTQDPALKNDLSEEKLLVQGVIDLVFEDRNGDITLCDYKTDYLTKDELSDPELAKKKLSDRHGEQLSYYAQAVKKLFEKAPTRICIYSLPLGDTVEI